MQFSQGEDASGGDFSAGHKKGDERDPGKSHPQRVG